MIIVPLLVFLWGKVTAGEFLQAVLAWNRAVDVICDFYLRQWLRRTHWFD